MWLGLALLISIYAGMAYYLSTTKIHINITSKTLAAAERKHRPTVSKVTPRRSNSPKILVIEDDTTTVHLIETQLSSAGYDVVICEQSESGLEMAAEIQPQAITLDLLMTPKSGWEILIQLKRDPRTMHIPVIAVTIVDHPSMGATLGSR